MMYKLRDYQADAVNAIDKYWISGRGDNPIVVAPTASGKSIMIAEYCKRTLLQYPNTRILMLTHQKELILQNFEKITSLFPNADAGIYSASVGRRDTHNSILFAGIQSIYNKVDLVGRFDLVLVDECHLIPKKGNGMYLSFLEGMKTLNPNIKVVGFTATPYRLNGGYLYEGEGKIFDGIAYNIPVKTLLDRGYIAPLVTPEHHIKPMDVSDVPLSGGDYVQYKLAKAVNQDTLVERAVHQMVVQGENRHAWLAFACSIEHAEKIKQALLLKRITVEVITGKTKKKDREQILADFTKGVYRCLVNVGVLTTGFDAPFVDMIGLLRPSKSTNYYIQVLGRGARIFPDGNDYFPPKKDCLILDFAGLILEHGAFDSPDIGEQSQGNSAVEGEAPTKDCEQCNEPVHCAMRVCPFCGFEFPKPEKSPHSDIASTLPLYSTEKGERIYPVDDIRFKIHKKSGQPNSCRVNYMHQGKCVGFEFLCFEHTGWALSRSVKWWQAVIPDQPLPFSSLNASIVLNMYVRKRIEAIKVTRNGKYRDIVQRKLVKLT